MIVIINRNSVGDRRALRELPSVVLSNHETSPISLYLFVEEDRLLFEMHNKKFKWEPVRVSGEGIGIANTTRRLQLLYPKRHKLKIEEKDNSYNVRLEIKLKGEQYPLEPTLGNE